MIVGLTPLCESRASAPFTDDLEDDDVLDGAGTLGEGGGMTGGGRPGGRGGGPGGSGGWNAISSGEGKIAKNMVSEENTFFAYLRLAGGPLAEECHHHFLHHR